MAADRGPAGELADAILPGTELTSSSEQTVFTELSPLDLYRTFDKEDAGRIDEARFTLCVKSLTGGLASTASSRAVLALALSDAMILACASSSFSTAAPSSTSSITPSCHS